MCEGSNLFEFLDLGAQPPADQFRSERAIREPQRFYPLEVYMCDDCGLAQLGVTVAPEVLYQDDYPYEASITRAGREHFARFAQGVVRQLSLQPNDLVVDLGSNVGTLLKAFRETGMQVRGVDPAPNIAEIACDDGIDTVCDFFGPGTADRIVRESGTARLITATNVFAHVGDLISFMAGIESLLADDGAFIVEAPYFGNLIAYCEYDTIYHEHLSYLSVRPLVLFFERFGMEVFDVQEVEIHGGSFRVFVGRRGHHLISSQVSRFVEKEAQTGLHRHDTLEAFANAVRRNRDDLMWLLNRCKAEGKSIVGVSAPAKGMTLLNYCQIDRRILDFVTEKSTLKIGRFTPGANIPVVPDEELLRTQPDFGLLLAWNFGEEIMKNLSEYRRRGGRFIIPIPTPRVVS